MPATEPKLVLRHTFSICERSRDISKCWERGGFRRRTLLPVCRVIISLSPAVRALARRGCCPWPTASYVACTSRSQAFCWFVRLFIFCCFSPKGLACFLPCVGRRRYAGHDSWEALKLTSAVGMNSYLMLECERCTRMERLGSQIRKYVLVCRVCVFGFFSCAYLSF